MEANENKTVLSNGKPTTFWYEMNSDCCIKIFVLDKKRNDVAQLNASENTELDVSKLPKQQL